MRLPIAMITVVAVLVRASALLLGCSGDDDNSDEEAIREVWDQFSAAVGQHDGERACSYISKQGQKQVSREGQLPDSAGGRKVTMSECAAPFRGRARDRAPGSAFARIPSVTVSEVSVDGDTATITFDQPSFPRFTAVRDGDQWLIEGPD
jgi:hypothetical protein